MQYIRVQLKSFKEVLNICQNENKNDHIILNILMLNMIDNLQKANNSNSNIKYKILNILLTLFILKFHLNIICYLSDSLFNKKGMGLQSPNI